jgi:Glycosyl transferase family 2
VTLFTTREEFKSSAGGMNWLHPLLDFYGDGHWCLIIDADELFVYPGFERHKISHLCKKLGKASYEEGLSR